MAALIFGRPDLSQKEADYRYDKATEIYHNCVLLEDAALELNDLKLFFKYHKIALRLFEYRIHLLQR